MDTPKSTGSDKLVVKATMEKRKFANVPKRIASSAILLSVFRDIKLAGIMVEVPIVSIFTNDSLTAIARWASASIQSPEY